MVALTTETIVGPDGTVLVTVGADAAGQSVTVTIVPSLSTRHATESAREQSERAIRGTYGAIPDLLEIEDPPSKSPPILNFPGK